MPLLDNLVSQWSLEESSGTRVDSHGSNNLTANNSIGSTTGKVGNAALCDKDTNQYLNIADNASLSTGDIDFTWAVWVKATNFPSFPYVFNKATTTPASGADFAHRLYYNTSSERFVFDVGNGTTFGSVSADNLGAASTGTWYFIVCKHDAANDQISIKVNNGTANTASYSGGSFDTAGDFEVGTQVSSGGFVWNGPIDELWFWKKVTSSTEDSDLYNSGNGLSYSSLLPAVTANVGVLTGILVLQDAQVTGGSSFSAPVLSFVSSFIHPDLLVDSNLAPAPLSATFSIPSIVTNADANVTPSVVSALFSLQAPAVVTQGDETVIVNTVGALFSTVSPTVQADSTFDATVLSATFFFQTAFVEVVSGGVVVPKPSEEWTPPSREIVWNPPAFDDNMATEPLTKRPGESRLYAVNFGFQPEIRDLGEVLSGNVTVSSSPSGLTVGSISLTPSRVLFRLLGGNDLTDYEITTNVNTSGGNTLVEKVLLLVRAT